MAHTHPPRILVTRPANDAETTAAKLAALGAEPVCIPLFETRFRPYDMPDPKDLSGLIITSTNALRALQNNNALTHLTGLPVFAVGDRTADAARSMGFTNTHSAGGSARELIEMINEQNFLGTLFYPSGAEVAHDLGAALETDDRQIVARTVYEMITAEGFGAAFAKGWRDPKGFDAALLYSRRAAIMFSTLLEEPLWAEVRRKITMICLSENVAAPLIEKGGARIALADYPSEEAMMAATLSFCRDEIR